MALTITCEDTLKPPKHSTRGADTPIKPYGGDFVDRDLELIMRNATGTLFSFLPRHYHGSTWHYGRNIVGIASTFSTHIHSALEKARTEPDGVLMEYHDILLADGEWRPVVE
jgi:hypothetical protein